MQYAVIVAVIILMAVIGCAAPTAPRMPHCDDHPPVDYQSAREFYQCLR